MFFLIRSAVIGAVIYGLCIWAFDASVSWTGFFVTAFLIGTILFIGTASMTILVILTILNDLDRDYRS